jgi:hypothetical protein
MTATEIIDVWMIEILGDGTGNRHRRYLVAGREREAAVAALRNYIGSDPLVTSSTKLEEQAAAVCKLAAGDVRQI